MECVGDRPFQGLHALTVTENGEGETTMIVGIQAALYQDGPTPTDFDGSATRILFFNVSSHNGGEGSTATYDKSYRYDTSHLTMDFSQNGGKYWQQLHQWIAVYQVS
jgi:hypothetical protein